MKQGERKQDSIITWSVVLVLVALIAVEAYLVLNNEPPNSKERLSRRIGGTSDSLHVREYDSKRHPLVLLYAPSEGKEPIWETAKWAGWGSTGKNLKNLELKQELTGAAKGVTIVKNCDVPCFITRDQSAISKADVVVMELVNHQKHHKTMNYNIPWPARYEKQKWAMFHYDPHTTYGAIADDELIVGRFDITMTPKQTSTLPVTIICDWGRSLGDYLLPPPPKSKFICDYSDTTDVNFKPFVKGIRKNCDTDTYVGAFKNQVYSDNLQERLDNIAQYKFIVIAEAIPENDWISPEWSQAFLVGTVPVYIGAPNIADYAPGPDSYISMRDFTTPEELTNRLIALNNDENAYQKYFAWKQSGLADKFKTHFENCVHHGECRLCKEILQEQ